MKNLSLIIILTTFLAVISCSKSEKSERFKLLTTPVWTSDSLLANGVDASGPGGLLVNFKGDAKFSEDGTGYFGTYDGTWRFNTAETEITIESASLQVPIICKIKELTSQSLKVTTVVPNPLNPLYPFNIRMTFKAK